MNKLKETFREVLKEWMPVWSEDDVAAAGGNDAGVRAVYGCVTKRFLKVDRKGREVLVSFLG